MEATITDVIISIDALSGTLAWAFGITLGLLTGLYATSFLIYLKLSKLEQALKKHLT